MISSRFWSNSNAWIYFIKMCNLSGFSRNIFPDKQLNHQIFNKILIDNFVFLSV